jgi:hypothetical protein
MALPGTPRVQLLIGGVWTDATADALLGQGMTVKRGRADESAKAAPGSGTFGLKNPAGKYSPRVPTSPNYKKIGRNTQARISTAISTTPWLDVPDGVLNRATTPDTGVLDIVGDIDVRVDAALAVWGDPRGTVELAAKWNNIGNQRSWLFTIDDQGRAQFWWTADGSTSLFANSTVAVGAAPGERRAVRATLDVNNGASGRTVTFYTAPTLAGPWTQLGSAVVQAGTTSIFSGSATVEVGDASHVGYSNWGRRIFAAEVRNGLAGTVVASPNFEALAVGATAFTDGAGRAWTVTAGAVTNQDIRLAGEIPSWPVQWDMGGKLPTSTLEASGILRRLQQGTPPVLSAQRRTLRATAPSAYWPIEDQENSTQAASGLLDGTPLRVTTGRPAFGATDGPPGSDRLADFSKGGTLTGAVPPSGGATAWSIELVMKFGPSFPSGFVAALGWTTLGSTYFWELDAAPAVDGGLSIQWADATFSNLGGPYYSNVGVNDEKWHHLRIDATQSGSNISLTAYLDGVSVIIATIPTVTIGDITNVTINPARSVDAGIPSAGHLTIWPGRPSGVDTYQASLGYPGEDAVTRLRRVATEAGISMAITHGTANAMPMGPQLPGTTVALLQEAADSDMGILYEPRRVVGLAYRRRHSLYNQTPVLELDYASGGAIADLGAPTDDDQASRNDITVTRIGGSWKRLVQADGELSVQDPPAGIGEYESGPSASLADDSLITDYAGWLLHLGTWDGLRFPTVKILLHKAPGLIAAAAALEVGDRITIANPPAWLPPDLIDLIVQGIQPEVIGVRTWEMTFVCTPAGPWDVGVISDPVYGRVDTDGSQLAAAVGKADTQLPVLVTAGYPWTTDPAEFPLDIQVGGEVMTVTGITGSAADTFARTVSPGWGTASTGQTWTTSGGSASDFSVQGV